MNKAEIEDIIRRLSVFRKEYRMLISSVAIDHMDATAVLLNTIAQLAPDDSPVPHPSNRFNGMCPCELADAFKKAGTRHDRHLPGGTAQQPHAAPASEAGDTAPPPGQLKSGT